VSGGHKRAEPGVLGETKEKGQGEWGHIVTHETLEEVRTKEGLEGVLLSVVCVIFFLILPACSKVEQAKASLPTSIWGS
jgi:hypothetical protein